MRRLFYAPRVVMLVATIGIAGLAQAIITAYPKLKDEGASYPVAIDKTWDDVVGLQVTGSQLAILVVVPIVTHRARLVAQPDHARPHGQGLGREPRRRARPGHQPQAGLDRGVGDRGAAGHDHDDARGQPDAARRAISPCSARTRWRVRWSRP